MPYGATTSAGPAFDAGPDVTGILSGFTGLSNFLGGIFNWFDAGRQREESMMREDTAIQRRVADLKAAGLSPTLAAGSAATTMPPVKREMPTINAQQLLGPYIDMQRLRNDNTMTRAQVSLLEKQKERMDVDIARDKQTLDFEAKYQPLRIQKLELENQFSGETLRSRVLAVAQKNTLNDLQALNREMDTRLKNAGITKAAYEAHYTATRDDLANIQLETAKKELMIMLATKEKILALKTLEAQFFGTDKAMQYGRSMTDMFRNITGVLPKGGW